MSIAENNLATYSYRAILNCIDIVEGVNVTVKRKAEHFQKAKEIESLLELLLECTGCTVFEPGHFTWLKEYKARLDLKATKSQLDSALNMCKIDILAELHDILRMIQNHKVNVIA